MNTLKKGIFLSFMLIILAFMADDQAVYAQGKGKKGNAVAKAGGPPPWAPAHGYRAKTRYVYFKDYAVYYDHERSVYISLAGSSWVVSANIPVNLRGIDLNGAIKIDIDMDSDEPQRKYSDHKKNYPRK